MSGLRIGGSKPGGPAAPARRLVAPAQQDGFTLPEPVMEEGAGLSPALPLPPLAMLETVAGVMERARADRDAADHGAALLAALTRLQGELAAGDAGRARDALRALTARKIEAADPGLRDLLQAVAQRAAIELARGG